jgi:hypothetical protein
MKGHCFFKWVATAFSNGLGPAFSNEGPSLFQMGANWSIKQVILLPKLLPFVKDCMKDCPNTIVQEDTAPSYASKHEDLVFMDSEVLRLLWPSNSPDLNMIEPCWSWMKRKTTRLGAPRSRAAATKAWTECWTKQLDQDRIQRWIERIPRHI